MTASSLFSEAVAEIQGAPDLFLRAGSSLRLVCTLRHSTEPPAFVFWYHEQRMINYDQGVTVKEGHSSSILHLQDADKSHNGNYTCGPSNAVPASINVHVLNATAGKEIRTNPKAPRIESVSNTKIFKPPVRY